MTFIEKVIVAVASYKGNRCRVESARRKDITVNEFDGTPEFSVLYYVIGHIA